MRLQNKGLGAVKEQGKAPAKDHASKAGTWFSRKPATAVHRPVTDPWTKGRSLQTKLITGACWATLIVWPILAADFFGGSSAPALSAPQPAYSGVPVREQNAGAAAQGYIAAWLSATRADTAGLEKYTDLAGTSLPEKAFEFRNLAVASVSPPNPSGLVQVEIAAQIKEISVTSGEGTQDPVVSWPQRYFQVGIKVTDTGLIPVGWPKAVSTPVQSGTALEGFRESLPAADPLAQSITSFLQAYAAGTGDITRYTSPEAEVLPITPAPYLTVKPLDFRVLAKIPEHPADGDIALTLTRVQLVTASGQQASAEYALELTSRAGRWEVSDINPAEPLSPAGSTTGSAGPSRTSSPTPAPAEK